MDTLKISGIRYLLKVTLFKIKTHKATKLLISTPLQIQHIESSPLCEKRLKFRCQVNPVLQVDQMTSLTISLIALQERRSQSAIVEKKLNLAQ